jgi:hypothetical protein
MQSCLSLHIKIIKMFFSCSYESFHASIFDSIELVLLVGEQGMVDEAQKALEEAEALKRVSIILLCSSKFHQII